MKKPIYAFAALSDEIRLRILYLLTNAKIPLSGCEMIDALEQPPNKLSHHLKILEYAGLVQQEKDGRWVYYSAISENEPFIRSIYSTVQSLSPEEYQQLKKDAQELKKRLRLRKNGKCVLGIQKEHLNPRSEKCCFIK